MEAHPDNLVLKAVLLMDTQAGLARAIVRTGGGEKTRQQHVQKWLRRGILPAEQVIPVCRAVRWKITPHQFRPDIYPYPSDALPRSMRKRMNGGGLSR